MKTEKTSRLPRFYTHVIGSLPRPGAVLELLGERRRMAPKRYARLIDEMVVFAIRLQEQAGIDVVSDGEWRRMHYVDEFLDRIGGFAPMRRYEHQGEEKTARRAPSNCRDRRSSRTTPASCGARQTATKFALPSPFLIAIRYWKPEHSRAPIRPSSISWSTWPKRSRARPRRSPPPASTSCSSMIPR